jgi:hypothetical protein
MAESVRREYLDPRVIRPVPDPLALYLRANRNDQPPLLDLLARRDANCFGIIIEATAVKAQRELRDNAASANLEVILDPRTQASATIGGFTTTLGKLPWGEERPHQLADFVGLVGRRRVAEIAQFAVANGFSQVLAPTHLITSSHDPWFEADLANVTHLRNALDKANGGAIDILYLLAIPYALHRDEHERSNLIEAMTGMPCKALWLQIDGLGSQATAAGVRHYIAAASDFKAVGIPVIADGIGGLAGLAVVGFGAVGGLAHGVTFGERIDHRSWRHARGPDSFGRPRRVYLRDLDLLFEPSEAEAILRSSTRATAVLGCRDTHCCPRGLRDMLENPARHFLLQRMAQLSQLSQLPPNVRPTEFIDRFVRPASDALLVASNWPAPTPEIGQRIVRQRRRMDALRIALLHDVESARRRTIVLPITRRQRDLRTGP